MTTVEHSTLTGSSLHEPKGVAAAAANKVYVSNGSGSGTWEQLPAAALASSANSFGAQLLHVREEQSSGTTSANGSSVAGTTEVVLTLNTIKTNEISGASLSSNQITLPAGTYYAEGMWAMGGSGGSPVGRCALNNVTDSTQLLRGPQFQDGSYVVPCPIKGRFTLSGTKTITFSWYGTGGVNTTGHVSKSGENEVYAELLIWKVA